MNLSAHERQYFKTLWYSDFIVSAPNSVQINSAKATQLWVFEFNDFIYVWLTYKSIIFSLSKIFYSSTLVKVLFVHRWRSKRLFIDSMHAYFTTSFIIHIQTRCSTCFSLDYWCSCRYSRQDIIRPSLTIIQLRLRIKYTLWAWTDYVFSTQCKCCY